MWVLRETEYTMKKLGRAPQLSPRATAPRPLGDAGLDVGLDTAPVSDQKIQVTVELTALLVAINNEQPRVLTLPSGGAISGSNSQPNLHSGAGGELLPILPSGPLESRHRSLQQGLRAWVELQTHHPLGYVEQLYSFADLDRRHADESTGRVISLSYLGLTREQTATDLAAAQKFPAQWQDWYGFFPWEDFRRGLPELIAREIFPGLCAWLDNSQSPAQKRERQARIDAAFNFTSAQRGKLGAAQRGENDPNWDEELVLERYEILYEAGLVAEAQRGHAKISPPPVISSPVISSLAMSLDHRRILATAIGRLRAKIKYRPVVFELMPESFTLTQLQRAVEALSGRRIHTQNFRRLIKQQNLLIDTGDVLLETGGRPARLMRAATHHRK